MNAATRAAMTFVSVVVLLLPVRVQAQDRGAWPERVFVTFDAPIQPLSNSFSETVAYPDQLRRTENVTFDAAYKPARGVVLHAGAGIRMAGNFGAGITGSWFQRPGTASFDVAIPNPLAANQPLTLSGDIEELDREELGIHLQALYAMPLGRSARLILSAGPSVFQVQQDVLTSVEFDRLPGFTRLEFHQALVSSVDETAVGFNVGADVTWNLWRYLGVGSVTRYSRATVTIDPGSVSGLSRTIRMRAGGFQVGGGIRFRF